MPISSTAMAISAQAVRRPVMRIRRSARIAAVNWIAAEAASSSAVPIAATV